MPSPRNIAAVADLEQRLRRARAIFLTDYRGLTVAELGQLRRQLREVGVEFRVAKNTLIRLAARRLGLTGLDGFLTGPTALALTAGDEITAARVLSEFARGARLLTLKGATVGHLVLSPEQVSELAALPGSEQVRANLVGSIQGPMAGLVGVLNSALASVIHALEERQKQLQAA
ncbi:MAG: 50S ribosomal protein L10 [Chloroflexi bacterium]|nr:50S ribosomal protein L10 [Chloroflexota bacterium]